MNATTSSTDDDEVIPLETEEDILAYVARQHAAEGGSRADLERKVRKAKAILALQHGATLSAAAEQAGVHRNTLLNWRKAPRFLETLLEPGNEILDAAQFGLAWSVRHSLTRVQRALADDATNPRLALDYLTRMGLFEQHRARQKILAADLWREYYARCAREGEAARAAQTQQAAQTSATSPAASDATRPDMRTAARVAILLIAATLGWLVGQGWSKIEAGVPHENRLSLRERTLPQSRGPEILRDSEATFDHAAGWNRAAVQGEDDSPTPGALADSRPGAVRVERLRRSDSQSPLARLDDDLCIRANFPGNAAIGCTITPSRTRSNDGDPGRVDPESRSDGST